MCSKTRYCALLHKWNKKLPICLPKIWLISWKYIQLVTILVKVNYSYLWNRSRQQLEPENCQLTYHTHKHTYQILYTLCLNSTRTKILGRGVGGWECNCTDHFIKYSVKQSDGERFYEDVVLDSFHISYRDEDSILEQKVWKANIFKSF